MVNYAYVQDRVDYGYGKAALKIGETVTIYRPSSGINPISGPNVVGVTYLSYNVDWSYMKANKPGNAIYQLIIDGHLIQPFDYLVYSKATFYVDEREPIAPVNGVLCNRIVNITRPIADYSPGANPYGGYEKNNILTIMESAPISVLQKGRGSTNAYKLPLDTKSPGYILMVPALPGVELRIGDLIDDDRGVRIALTNVEKSEFGFRCLADSVEV